MSIKNAMKAMLSRDTVLRRFVKKIAQPILIRQRNASIKRYNEWFQNQMPTEQELIHQRESSERLQYTPMISIVVPVYNPPIEYFREMIVCVLEQTYANWELILVDDASPDDKVRRIIKQYASKDKRIKYRFLETNHHISGATNKGIEMASGEFISLLDNDDIIYAHTLYEVVSLLNKRAELDLIYTDEDKIEGSTGIHTSPYFKPSLNPDFLHSVNYITHFTTIRKSILQKTGLLNGKFDGAQDWELFLRITRSVSPDRITHIPKVLYSWRVHEASTAANIEAAKPYVIEAQRSSLKADLEARVYGNYDLSQDPLYPAQWIVKRHVVGNPSVTVIPMVQGSNIRNILNTYSNCSTLSMPSGDLREIAEAIDGEFVAFVYEQPIGGGNPYLIEELLAEAQRSDISFVSSAYLLDSDTILNINSMINENALSLVSEMNKRDVTKHFYTTTKYNTPRIYEKSCVMIEAKKLREVINLLDGQKAGLTECSEKASSMGYRNLYNPYIKLL